MDDADTPDRSIEDFRRWGHAVVDWAARYLAEVETHPVQSRAHPGDLRAALPASPPESPEDFGAVLADLDRVVMPGLLHWQSPRFFGYFPANRLPSSVLGELVSAALGVQGMLWSTSPACTELETHVLDWLVEALALPEKFRGGGVIQDSASSATLCALLAAREGAVGEARAEIQPRLRAYASADAHSSVPKAVRIAGLDDAQLHRAAVDGARALDPADLARRVEADLAAGLRPFFVVATVGTTSSMAFDPLPAIAALCRRHGIWLHVDAAMAGTAALCPEHRAIHAGLELADSYCFNPHKWLGVNFDCDAFYVADPAALTSALSVTPAYLRNPASESGEVHDYRDWQVPLGRRFRALKLWFVLRSQGLSGLRAMIRRHVELAEWFVAQVRASDGFELTAPPALNLVCFRHVAGDDFNRALLERVNAGGAIFLSHTELDGVYTLRLAVGQVETRRPHVELAWRALTEAAAALG